MRFEKLTLDSSNLNIEQTIELDFLCINVSPVQLSWFIEEQKQRSFQCNNWTLETKAEYNNQSSFSPEEGSKEEEQGHSDFYATKQCIETCRKVCKSPLWMYLKRSLDNIVGIVFERGCQRL